jgi:MFS family permease
MSDAVGRRNAVEWTRPLAPEAVYRRLDLTATGTLLTGIAPVPWFAVAAQAIGGLGNGADNVASDTLIQRSVPGTCAAACSG